MTHRQVAVLTGASSGTGKAAAALLQQGWRVIGVSATAHEHCPANSPAAQHRSP